jgi:hypothetical protein
MLILSVNYIFSISDKLKSDFIEPLTDFLSFFLINTQLQWEWNEWIHAADIESFSYKKIFLRSLFFKLSLGINREKLQDALPKELFAMCLDKTDLYFITFANDA